MRSTCFSAANSSLPFSKTGLVSQGSTKSTFPPGVTILNPDCPYQVSRVCAIASPKRKRAVEQNIFLSERKFVHGYAGKTFGGNGFEDGWADQAFAPLQREAGRICSTIRRSDLVVRLSYGNWIH